MSGRNRLVSSRQSGFTLVEMLIVIGIITLLVGILVPVVFKARRGADRARTEGDLRTITTALDAFKQTTGYYPPVPWKNIVTNVNITDGSKVLFAALANGVQLRQGGLTYGPFIDPSKFNVTGGTVNDRNGTLILYFPASSERLPDLTATGIVYCGNTTTAPLPFYSHTADSSNKLPIATWRTILGADPATGALTVGQTPSYTGPFILWAAGPDKIFGYNPTTGTKLDDVTNFEIPSQYRSN